MNKKYLSALLFGALTLASTGTFTSCKDYDDDIENLQGQIDKLTAEDLKSKISTLETALGAAAQDAKSAITKAEEAKAEAKKAGDAAAEAKAAAEEAEAKAKAAAVAEANKVVEAAKTELKEMVEKGLAENEKALAEMNKQVKEATDKVEAIVGKIADMVTHVDLVTMDQLSSLPMYPLLFQTAMEQNNVFGEGLDGEITFKEGNQFQRGSKIWVRVSPTNAVLTKDMISLVDSKGNSLDEVLDLEVKPFDGLLQGIDPEGILPLLPSGESRAALQNGLWEVSVKLKEYDKEAFEKLTNPKSPFLTTLYAVQVNNTLSTAASRYVTSAYDLQMHWLPYFGERRLDFTVNGKNVRNIANRYKDELGNTFTGEPNKAISYQELRWNGLAQVTATKKNTADDDFDNRTYRNHKVLPVAQGEEITIELGHLVDDVLPTDEELVKDLLRKGFGQKQIDAILKVRKDVADINIPSNVRGLYVTLDLEDNAIESDPSEWNAWNSYTYTGLNKVVEGTTAKISIDASKAINDIIGFRVYAVNYDGTLVDPDGKAFYVSVGKQVETVEFDLDWTWTALNKSAISLAAIPEGTFTKDWVAEVAKKNTVIESDTVAYLGYKDAKPFYNTIFSIYADADGKPCGDVLKAKYISLNLNEIYMKNAPFFYDDDKVYSVKYILKNANNNDLKVLKFNLKKVLPTAIPYGFDFKTNIADANGLVKVYPTDEGANATYGMSNIFNVTKDADDLTLREIMFAEICEGENTVSFESTDGLDKSSVEAKKVDSKTAYPVSVTYDYGSITSKRTEEYGHDLVVSFAKPFSLMFCSKVGTSEMTAVAPIQLTYGKVNSLNLTSLKLTSDDVEMPWATYTRPSTKVPTDLVYNNATSNSNKWATKNVEIKAIESVKVISAEKEEYFMTVEGDEIKHDYVIKDAEGKVTAHDFGINIKPVPSTEAQLTKEVPATLVVTIVDKYGNKFEKKVDATIIPQNKK